MVPAPAHCTAGRSAGHDEGRNKYIPRFIRNVADALPLKPLIDGLYGAMVTGTGLTDNLDALAVIGLWGVFGVWLAIRGFTWEQRRG